MLIIVFKTSECDVENWVFYPSGTVFDVGPNSITIQVDD